MSDLSGEQGPQHPSSVESGSSSLYQLSEQLPVDILKNGANEEKVIAGKFKMAWPPMGDKMDAIVTTGQTRETFRVSFLLNEAYLKNLEVSPHDDFRLSLRGAEVQKLPQIPQLSTLPMQLNFSKGVHIEWRPKGIGEMRKLNTWLPHVPDDASRDSWFLSQDKKDRKPEQSVKRKHDEVELDCQPQISKDASTIKERKKRRRQEAKLLKKQAASSNATVESSTTTGCEKTITPPPPIYENSPLIHFHKTESEPAPDSNASSPEKTASYGVPSAKDEFSTPGITPLKDIRPGRSKLLIGVVTEISSHVTTRTGDWMCFVHIVDKTNCHTSGFKINCFTKRYQEWLPHADVGDVLVLRDVQIVEYNGHLAGTGYHGKLSWASFSPTKGQIHHGPSNSAPRQEGLTEGGFGAQFSPFCQPGSSEIQYCVRLADWWREMNTNNAPDQSVCHKAAATNVPQVFHSVQRIHRLISEAGPLVQPNGYFDCTIEVIEAPQLDNFHMKCTVYVTDYTRNTQLATMPSNRCPSTLSECVLPLEMWDSAAAIAQKMRPGQFYSIKNARMRVNPRGYLEGKVVQDKIVQLSENEVTDEHLTALLERRRAWEAKKASAESEIVYRLISEIEENKFFHCTVELLHTQSRPGHKSCLYVTDYTSHPRLGTINEPWSQGLKEKIVKIFLSEEQENAVNLTMAGTFYYIKKLRLKYSTVEDSFCGILGGSEKLVVPLNPHRIDNEHLNGLMRRKEQWQTAKRRQSDAIEDMHTPPTSATRNIAPITAPGSRSCIQFIANSESMRHQIVARAVDFYPLELNQAFYQQCTRCDLEISKRQRACTKCGDFNHEYIQYFYQLYLMLEDEDKNQMIVSIDDKCSLLAGLKRTCISDDNAALSEFRQQVNPLLGNLVMVHNGLKSNVCMGLITPLLHFDLESWFLPGGRRAFRLNAYTDVSA